jgi:2,5-diketo-D-gluconate reductase A
MTEPTTPTVTLNNGVVMPAIGFGVFQVPPADTAAAVAVALEAGYRSIDTASLYKNETETGTAIRESGVPRDEVFLTTKAWNDEQGFDGALAAFDASVARLGVDIVDLYLIHWPCPAQDTYIDTWRAFERLMEEGRVRAIGVSNFQPAHLRRLLDHTGVTPAVNQVELHPLLQQRELRAYHAANGIATEAWSPLVRGQLLGDPTIAEIAARHDRSPAQVVLAWHLAMGTVIIPRSVTPSRIRENLDITDIRLSADETAAIDAMDRGGRIGPDPDAFG